MKLRRVRTAYGLYLQIQEVDGFTSSMSEVAVTADEIPPHIDDLPGTVVINGVTGATLTSAGVQHSLGEVLAHAPRGERPRADGRFGTRTLPGGSGLETGNWLRPGGTLQLCIDEIGSIEHAILGS